MCRNAGIGKQVFSTKDYKNLNHCFAISSHKSQGQTVDNTYHLGNSFTSSNKSYVDGSRHKESYKLYLKDSEVEKFKKNAVKSQVKETTLNDKNCKQAVIDFVSIQEAQIKSNLEKVKVLEAQNKKFANEKLKIKLAEDEKKRVIEKIELDKKVFNENIHKNLANFSKRDKTKTLVLGR